MELTKKYFDEQFENLTSSVKAGFDNTATKKELNTLETKVDGLETKVDGLETKVDGLETKVDGLETKIDKIDERLQIVETKLDRALYSEYVHLETRVKKLEQHTGIKP